MERLFLLLLFCHVSSPEKHFLKFFLTGSTGVPNFPGFSGALMIDDVLAVYCDNIKNVVETKQPWSKELLKNNPDHLKWFTTECFEYQPDFFKAKIHDFKERFSQSGDMHILQTMSGCEWDDETGEDTGFLQYGYDGEDFIAFDLKTLTWIAPTPQAVTTKLKWDTDKARSKDNEISLTQICPEWLRKYVVTAKSSQPRTELPLVSLLQKSPSSPVSCHATGFYPDRAVMFWRKDGEELHEDVDHGEILLNHDGTFQMSVDLKLSSVTPEDWSRYDCMFHLFGAKAIVTRLDKVVIRTNWAEEHSDVILPVTAAVVVVLLLLLFVLIAVFGFIIYKRKKAKSLPSSSDNSFDLSEALNPET